MLEVEISHKMGCWLATWIFDKLVARHWWYVNWYRYWKEGTTPENKMKLSLPLPICP